MEGGSGGVTLLHVAEGVLVLKKQRLGDTKLGPAGGVTVRVFDMFGF